MNVLVTGGAGFIGRWVAEKLLEDGHNVWILDNFSNGQYENIKDLVNNYKTLYFHEGDIKDQTLLTKIFQNKLDVCYHLAASINVQDSIDDPETTFQNDTVGAFYVLEACKQFGTKMVFMSTCMVYDRAFHEKGIDEAHPTKPTSPYAASKIAAENMVLSYHYAYGLPVVVLRPFNTYGPFQKSGGEGGVVAIFVKNKLNDKKLMIYGDGMQTRDLLYVEDCAEFVVHAGYSDQVNGQILNAGSGRDISINALADLIIKEHEKIEHVKHIHPQSEIKKLLCNYDKVKKILKWKPTVSLEAGIEKTEAWIQSHLGDDSNGY